MGNSEKFNALALGFLQQQMPQKFDYLPAYIIMLMNIRSMLWIVDWLIV